MYYIEVILHMTNHHDPTGYTSESYIAANASVSSRLIKMCECA